jgi:hypothetical protein
MSERECVIIPHIFGKGMRYYAAYIGNGNTLLYRVCRKWNTLLCRVYSEMEYVIIPRMSGMEYVIMPRISEMGIRYYTAYAGKGIRYYTAYVRKWVYVIIPRLFLLYRVFGYDIDQPSVCFERVGAKARKRR